MTSSPGFGWGKTVGCYGRKARPGNYVLGWYGGRLAEWQEM